MKRQIMFLSGENSKTAINLSSTKKDDIFVISFKFNISLLKSHHDLHFTYTSLYILKTHTHTHI